MQHDARSVHTYYGSNADCQKLVAWLMDKHFWFEGDQGHDGYVIRCAVSAAEVRAALGVVIETIN